MRFGYLPEASLGRILQHVKSGEGFVAISSDKWQRRLPLKNEDGQWIAEEQTAADNNYWFRQLKRVFRGKEIQEPDGVEVDYPVHVLIEDEWDTIKSLDEPVPFIPIKGSYQEVGGDADYENSLFIPYVDEEFARSLCEKFGDIPWDQESVLFGQEGEGVWLFGCAGRRDWHVGDTLEPGALDVAFSAWHGRTFSATFEDGSYRWFDRGPYEPGVQSEIRGPETARQLTDPEGDRYDPDKYVMHRMYSDEAKRGRYLARMHFETPEDLQAHLDDLGWSDDDYVLPERHKWPWEEASKPPTSDDESDDSTPKKDPAKEKRDALARRAAERGRS